MSKDLHGQIPGTQESAVSNSHIIFQRVLVEKFGRVISQQILQKSNFISAGGYFFFLPKTIQLAALVSVKAKKCNRE